MATRYKSELTLGELSPETALVIAYEVCEQLGWKVSDVTPSTVTAYTSFSWASWNEEVTITIGEGVLSIFSKCIGAQMHDWGKNEKNAAAFTEAFAAHSTELNMPVIEGQYNYLKANYGWEQREEEFAAEQTGKSTKGGFLQFFTFRKGYTITPLIMYLNILVFIIMVSTGVGFFAPDIQDMLSWGANFGEATLGGQWWRLLTYMFIHYGILHLVMNTYAFLFIGIILEPILGKARFLTAYILTGIAGGLLSLYAHQYVVSAGASGAIFGMYGLFLALLSTGQVEPALRKAVLPSVAIFVVYNLLGGMKAGVDNACHIGGLLGGLIVGYAFYPSMRNYHSAKVKWVSIASLTVLYILIVAGALYLLPECHMKDDLTLYREKMEKFENMEQMALEVYNMPLDTNNKEQILYGLKERGTYYWDECSKVLKEVDELSVNDKAKELNGKLKQYCALRRESYELLYKKVNENTDIYDTQLERLNEQIVRLLNDVKSSMQAK